MRASANVQRTRVSILCSRPRPIIRHDGLYTLLLAPVDLRRCQSLIPDCLHQARHADIAVRVAFWRLWWRLQLLATLLAAALLAAVT